jgi:hypothetical protein
MSGLLCSPTFFAVAHMSDKLNNAIPGITFRIKNVTYMLLPCGFSAERTRHPVDAFVFALVDDCRLTV